MPTSTLIGSRNEIPPRAMISRKVGVSSSAVCMFCFFASIRTQTATEKKYSSAGSTDTATMVR